MRKLLRDWTVIWTTFVLALIAALLPMPAWAEPFRPDWTALLLIFWCMTLPERVNVGTGWTLGLILDVLYGSLLGGNALAKALTAYLAVRFHLRLRMFPLWQQALSVFGLVALGQFMVLWTRHFTHSAPAEWRYWAASFVSMLVWPWVYVLLRDLRRWLKPG